MDLREIRRLPDFAHTRNFTRAAEECGVTQPSLTSVIQKMERELGAPLLECDRSFWIDLVLWKPLNLQHYPLTLIRCERIVL